MPWRGLLGANSHSKKFKSYRAATGYYTVDKYIQDGQLRFDKKFKLFIGMQNECCYVVLYFPGFTGMVGRYVLNSQFTYLINGSDTIIMCDTRSHHIGVYCMNRRDLAERMHGDVGREL